MRFSAPLFSILFATSAPIWAAPSTETTGKIAFISNRDHDDWQIYAMNGDGSNPTRLTRTRGYDSSPAFSRDGSKIVFESNRDGDGNSEIYVMNADGSAQKRLTRNRAEDNSPAFSPDGSHIVFHSNRSGHREIYCMSADGTSIMRLTTSNLAARPNQADYEDRNSNVTPTFSPDGKKIVFQSMRDGNAEIYEMGADGSKPTRLTRNLVGDIAPTFSPDGRKILFSSLQLTNYTRELREMNADGSDLITMARGGSNYDDATFSPDGKRIAFGSNRDGHGEIYSIRADGIALQRLTKGTKDSFNPTWAPGFVPAPRLSAPPVREKTAP